MLSTAAANALLKTLEEPPSHVVFVLATTDPQKVPPTIRSRTQHLEFRLLGAETLHDLLESINEEAGLQVDEEALEAAVRRGRGVGPRRALRVGPGRRLGLGRLGPTGARGRDRRAGRWRCQPGAGRAERAPGRRLGPQQLGTELIDDLRQVFLAALAPELCTVSGPSLQRFRAAPKRWGWPRVVRSMRILGHALVDMREAPDAQVSWRSPPCARCGPTSIRGWRRCRSGSACSSVHSPARPRSPDPVPPPHAPGPRRPRLQRRTRPRRHPRRRAHRRSGAKAVARRSAAEQGKALRTWRPRGDRPRSRCIGPEPATPPVPAAPAGASPTLDPRDSLTRPGATAFCQRLPARAQRPGGYARPGVPGLFSRGRGLGGRPKGGRFPPPPNF